MSGDGKSADGTLDFFTKIAHSLTAVYTHFCSVGKTCYLLVGKGGRNANLTTEFCLMSNWSFTFHIYIYIFIFYILQQ